MLFKYNCHDVTLLLCFEYVTLYTRMWFLTLFETLCVVGKVALDEIKLCVLTVVMK